MNWRRRVIPIGRFDIINKGIGGNKITDLSERWRDDVLFHKPDRLSIKIGINDLHSHLRGADGGVSPELFAERYDGVLALTKQELGCPLLLISPFYISRDNSRQTLRSQVLELLPRYIETVEALSEKYGARIVRSHEIFQRHLQFRDAEVFCPEPVHPNRAGHLVIAEEVMKVMGG